MMRNYQLETSLERYFKPVRESFFSTSYYEKKTYLHMSFVGVILFIFCLFFATLLSVLKIKMKSALSCLI